MDTAAPSKPRPVPRRGSMASDRQLGRAASEGRSVTFYPVGHDPLRGYVVGMDDYHWTVATVTTEGPGIIALVHRTCPLVAVSTDPTLDLEPEEFRTWVTSVGRAFWAHCSRTYLGK